MSDFSGEWFTTFGKMTLTQTGAQIAGTYHPGPVDCQLQGTVTGDLLRFRYTEPGATGEGWFALKRPGRFAGQWREDGKDRWLPWEGQRGFDGVWQTSFGPMRLIQGADEVHGFYEGVGTSTIQGQIRDGRLEFTYQEPSVRGQGWFELTEDGMNFRGLWCPDGADSWNPWLGQRRLPISGLSWLVVFEAYWQRGLGEKEYAFGNMLREFFARVPQIEVRQRFFTNESGLAKWCRELLYIPEPTALVLATHGTAEGLTAGGELIRPEPLAEVLRHADNVQVLHFSSCLLMDQGKAGDFARVLRKDLPFPISGYTTSVDWAASALIEFTYLDMILARGLEPAKAGEQVVKLIGFAGQQGAVDSPYPPAHFTFWPADK